MSVRLMAKEEALAFDALSDQIGAGGRRLLGGVNVMLFSFVQFGELFPHAQDVDLVLSALSELSAAALARA